MICKEFIVQTHSSEILLKWLKFLGFWLWNEVVVYYLIAFAIIHGKTSSTTAKSISFGTKEFAVAGATKHFSIMLGDSSRVKQLFTIGCKGQRVVKVSILLSLKLDRFKDTIKSFCAIFFKSRRKKEELWSVIFLFFQSCHSFLSRLEGDWTFFGKCIISVKNITLEK